MEFLICLLIVLVTAIIVWSVTSSVLKGRLKRVREGLEAKISEIETNSADKEKQFRTRISELENQLSVLTADHAVAKEREEALSRTINDLKASSQKALDDERASHERMRGEMREAHEKAQADLKEAHERAKAEIKEAHDKALKQQLEALRAEMTAQTEAILKQREQELDEKAEKTFKDISGDLGKNLKDMKEAFDAGRKEQLESSVSLKERFDHAVTRLEAQTKDIGSKADHLAEALRGQKKFQGCWGETILLNLLQSEGMVEGRDFEKEATLRDELGFLILNEDTEKRMRPDFILHFPDDNDIVVDAKVSLNAFSDWVEAKDGEAKADAARRNTAAIKEQVKLLSKKDYSRYLRSGHKMLDYVIMFIPNYPALQLAYAEDPNIWKEAYAAGVLVTTEETLMPFLRMITIAWTNVEQVRNQQLIITSAENMIERVAEFAKSHEELGRKLDSVRDTYDACSSKLKDSGRSIITSAKQVISYGVKSKKPLPEN